MYDVVIIGAGIIGTNIAYNLGKFDIKVLVLEQELDIATKTSKANSGIIHSGYDCKPNTLKANMNIAGKKLYPELAKKLNFPYKQLGSLVLAFNDEEIKQLYILYDQGIKNNIETLSIIDRDQIMELEPNINDNVKKALYAPDAAIICPYEATLAFAENAVSNKVTFSFDQKVNKILKIDDYFIINDQIETSFIINATGVHSDDIASLIGDDRYQITARKGEYLLLDRSEYLFNHVIFQTPTDMGKGILIVPTVDGNTMIGPTAVDQIDKEDDSVTQAGIDEIKRSITKLTTKINLRKVITEFSGLRAIYEDDFVIEPSTIDPHFINLIGIASPGLASAPAIGEYVVEILTQQGLNLTFKDNFIAERAKPIKISELDQVEYDKLISKYPLYGKIICRCETVSEQEIINAIKDPLPALTLDGIKRRTRAGMGRCQGSFCSIKIMELLSEYQNVDMTKVYKSSPNSPLVIQKTKTGNHDE
jgi:glycerol-3-phosphate dehydrogenase